MYFPLIGLSLTFLFVDNTLDSNIFAEAAHHFEVVELIKWPVIKYGCSGMFLVWPFNRGTVELQSIFFPSKMMVVHVYLSVQRVRSRSLDFLFISDSAAAWSCEDDANKDKSCAYPLTVCGAELHILA